ncbi:MAG: hypothetical protein PWP37_1798, partial [Thermotogota bacterium]|nr:hypothetical protein [Thermotogota bacterium]
VFITFVRILIVDIIIKLYDFNGSSMYNS